MHLVKDDELSTEIKESSIREDNIATIKMTPYPTIGLSDTGFVYHPKRRITWYIDQDADDINIELNNYEEESFTLKKKQQ